MERVLGSELIAKRCLTGYRRVSHPEKASCWHSFSHSRWVSPTAESPPEPGGTIQGVVVNGTRENEPLEGAEVLLRAGTDGELTPVAETKTDRYGKFLFSQVPPDPTLEYLPGANRDGVHYPGQRVRLEPSNPIASVTIVVVLTL